MSIKFILFLLIGTLAMFFPIQIMGKSHNVSVWKNLVITVVLTVTGTFGTFLMFYIENGYFDGISFFGAVFFVPLVFPLVSLLLRLPYGNIMDYCAAGECVMLALMKVHCLLSGCCIGRVLCVTQDETEIRFPSRISEMIAAVIIFLILFKWFKSGRKSGKLYGWYMLLYGCIRFVLNILREHSEDTENLLPIGNIWSLVAIVGGLLWIFMVAYIDVNKKHKEMNQSDSKEETQEI